MFNLFKREKPKKKHIQQRAFVGARPSAINAWNTSYNRINTDLRSDLRQLIIKSRDLSRNNSIVASYLSLMQRNILGSVGFTFTAQTGDAEKNAILEQLWVKDLKHPVSIEGLRSLEFDKLVLRTLLIDGEVFIRRHHENGKLKYELIDSLDVDLQKTQLQIDENGNRIIMGIKVDKYYRPVSFFIKPSDATDYYSTGFTEQIPASEIIHIFEHKYAHQVRGIPYLSNVLIDLNSLDTYVRSEINASLIASTFLGLWQENNSSANSYDDYDEDEVDNSGNVATELEEGAVFRYTPKGYKFTQPNFSHPNQNIIGFLKSVIRSISSALGLSANKLSSDYESVNYSGLKVASSEDRELYRDLQKFLINEWKLVQYRDWLQNKLMDDIKGLYYSDLQSYEANFLSKNFEDLDAEKELKALQLKLQLKLTDPITELEKEGMDVDEVMAKWKLFNDKLLQYGLTAVDYNGEKKTNEGQGEAEEDEDRL